MNKPAPTACVVLSVLLMCMAHFAADAKAAEVEWAIHDWIDHVNANAGAATQPAN